MIKDNTFLKVNNFKLIKKILFSLNNRRKKQLYIVFITMLLSGLAEAFTIFGAIPFLSVLLSPGEDISFPLSKLIINFFGMTNQSDISLLVFIIFLVIVIFCGVIRLINLWLNNHMAALIGSDISCQIYKGTLCQPYETHINRNSNEVIADLSNLIHEFVIALTSVFSLCTACVVSISIVIAVITINWKIALFSSFLIFISYSIFIAYVKSKLSQNSKVIVSRKKSQLKAIQEGLGAIRDVILNSSYSLYLRTYRNSDIPMRRKEAQNAFLNLAPRYAFESLGLIVIVLISIFLFSRDGENNSTNVIALLGILALCAQRLLPTSQLIYTSWSRIRGRSETIYQISKKLDISMKTKINNTFKKNLEFQNSIKLENVYFKYIDSNKNVLSKINLEIKKGERLAIIGTTGSGKSTLVDIIIGLLKPTKGKVYIDKNKINSIENYEILEKWRNSISHVPQDIFMADATITENIALGIDPKEIDFDKVKIASKKAQIHNYINTLDKGYQTFVGERGVKLSGGQKQRIAIARGLYRDLNVLVFDEATSALDVQTENSVMESIDNLSDDLTIIIIAHRLTTVKNCNRIIKIENGMIQEEGDYQSMVGR